MNRPRNALTPSAITTGLAAPLALAAPGNLDAGFADHGRAILETQYGGQVWSVEALDDGELFVAGGDFDGGCFYWYYCDYLGSGFAEELAADGTIKATYGPSPPIDFEIRDAARLPDGKVIMAGRRTFEAVGPGNLAVYRLDAGGTLDATFGAQGLFVLPLGDYGTERHIATSVMVDADGRIVASGSSDDHLIAVRLLADGTLDPSFGDGGVFTGPEQDYDSRTFIEGTAAGGYRISTTGASECRVVGLTADGVLDDTYGTDGVAPAVVADTASCGAMAAQADGSLLVGGSAGEQAFLTRLLESGAPDPAFDAAAVAGSMTGASAIAIAGDGKILVAGNGEPGAMITRLEAGGAVDASFGEAGTTLIDLPAGHATITRINALDVGADGRILAAGGDLSVRAPFIVQLVGDGGSDSPGVLGFSSAPVDAAEGSDLVVKVRRTGGKSGAVSVNYETEDDIATADEDFDEVSGTLNWPDGDVGEREIVVPVLDNDGDPEEPEAFRIVLSEPDGGAGLGTWSHAVAILPDGAPAGQFAVDPGYTTVEPDEVQVWVYRNFYQDGAVSVTVTPISGSAEAGEDFDATPVTLTWSDQDSEPKSVSIPILDDDENESLESFTVELSNPTGGAILGTSTVAEFEISANDAPARGRGGSGSTGWLSLLLLALANIFRTLKATASRA